MQVSVEGRESELALCAFLAPSRGACDRRHDGLKVIPNYCTQVWAGGHLQTQVDGLPSRRHRTRWPLLRVCDSTRHVQERWGIFGRFCLATSRRSEDAKRVGGNQFCQFCLRVCRVVIACGCTHSSPGRTTFLHQAMKRSHYVSRPAP